MSELDERIREVHENRGVALNLSTSNLREIPDAVFKLSGLEELELRNNEIQVVPERIRDLGKLKRLSLIHNPIRKVPNVPGLVLDWDAYVRCRPDLARANIAGVNVITGLDQTRKRQIPESALLLPELKRLPVLRELRIGPRRFIVQIPLLIPGPDEVIGQLIQSIGEFLSLESLIVFGVLLGEVPSGIRKLGSLRRLELNAIGLTEAPHWLGELTQLDTLDLGLNDLERLPESLVTLPLTTLGAFGDRFTSFPEVIFRIPTLTHVRLDSWEAVGYEGRIKQIPAEILGLPNLKTLGVKGQPIWTGRIDPLLYS